MSAGRSSRCTPKMLITKGTFTTQARMSHSMKSRATRPTTSPCIRGERLRVWMGVDRDVFYDESRIAIIPMGYCYPGRGNGGDMPPRRECASLWLDQLLARLPRIELTLLIGQYAQRHFLGSRRKPS